MQQADGRIIFAASEAKVQGAKAGDAEAKEITFTGPGSVSWEYKPTRWGMYDLHLVHTCRSLGEAVELGVDVGEMRLQVQVHNSPQGDVFQTSRIARVYLPKSEPYTLTLRAIQLPGNAVLKVRSVTFTPAPEGVPIVQKGEQITLASSNATTHSVMMRYEPATNKNCLGYWTNPSDTAEWNFTVTKPGSYGIELWQGAGKGQGGSDVAVEIRGKNGVLKEAKFVVEETGHFQNFIPRDLGEVNFAEAGEYALWVKPLNKKAAAVMDIRRIVLASKETASATPRVGAPILKAVLEAKRVVVLGDSITYGGEYVDLVETYMRLKHPEAKVEFINLGLPSETVSGLSEPGHADGKFPRPDLHERLERVLEKTKPDLIFACYGMNDGIYHPFSEKILGSYKDGIRRLRESAEKAGAKVIHVTPPTFDPVPLKGRTLPAGQAEYKQPFEGYNEVLDRFSEWLLARRQEGWQVIDAHFPMNRFLAERRKADAKFLLAGDGVHANSQGNWLIARAILRELGASKEVLQTDDSTALLKEKNAAGVHKLVQQRQRVLKDAWLTEVGHQRPGMNKGKPLSEAQAEAAQLTAQIGALIGSSTDAGASKVGTSPTLPTLRLARFDIDATPPVGSHMAYDPVTNKWDLGLRARGIVLMGAEAPIVLCAVDWIGIANEGHDAFRDAIAQAAGTTRERVAVHALHQHDAPDCDFSAEKILEDAGMDARQFEGGYQREVLTNLVVAVRKSLAQAQPITHLGLGEAKVEKVASNRRIFGASGKVRATRYTACTSEELRNEPEGVIDPELSLVSFWNEGTPVAVLSYYATHPQSYYRVGIANPDFPGVARFFRQLREPAALHVHFNGAGGNIGAGKYNDGSQTNRLTLAERVAEGMRQAWENTKRERIEAADVGWAVESVALKPSKHLLKEALEAELAAKDPKLVLQGNASRLAWLRRCLAGQKLDVGCLKLGKARILHLPGELFVEYQLAAKAERADEFVAMAAYGDYGPWYIGTAKAYEEGGYETEPRSSNVGPEAEAVLMGAIRKLLKE